jgi:hypothetical protein
MIGGGGNGGGGGAASGIIGGGSNASAPALLRILLEVSSPGSGGGGGGGGGSARSRARSEYLGFVEIDDGTTLRSLRGIISRTLDAATVPAHYSFLARDGSFVGSRHEGALAARRFLPALSLMATSESPLAERARVELWTGARFDMLVLASCAVRELRAEAARFWRLNPADTVLRDGAGAAWADFMPVHEALAAAAAAGALQTFFLRARAAAEAAAEDSDARFLRRAFAA